MTAAETCPDWCTQHWKLAPDGGMHMTTIPFGPVLRDGTRDRVEIRQYIGGRALRTGSDPANPWRNGTPQASLLISDENAHGCRAAAAALIQAAEVIEAATSGSKRRAVTTASSSAMELAR